MSREPVRRDITVRCTQGTLATSILEAPLSTFPVMILLHGFLSNRREVPVEKENAGMFEVLSHKLAEREISTVRFDFRGCGESSGLPLGACTPTGMVQDIISLVTSQELAPILQRGFILVGWCQGAVAAIHAALLGLQGCSRIVLLNPFVDFARTLEHVYGEQVCSKAIIAAPDSFLEIQMASGKYRRVVAGFFQEMFQIDERNFIRRVPVPVHTIKATRDTILPKQDAFFVNHLNVGGTCDLVDTDHAFGSFTKKHVLEEVTNLLNNLARLDSIGLA